MLQPLSSKQYANFIKTSLTAALMALNLGVSPSFADNQPTDGIKGVGKMSVFRKFAPTGALESQAAQQYGLLKQEAAGKRALAPNDHPQVQRLRAIGMKLIPYSNAWNDRAKQWQWEVNLIGSQQVNAFCMPGGKIAFYTGILDQLKLTDDEVAMVMGHEIAHALREHGQERYGKQVATQGAIALGSALFGLGDLGRTVAGASANLLTLKFGREDESEADLVGMDLAARAGYDPRAGVTLWQKMSSLGGGKGGPAWLSTHPSGANRISDIQKHLPEVLPLYAKAIGHGGRYQLPPYRSNWANLPAVN